MHSTKNEADRLIRVISLPMKNKVTRGILAQIQLWEERCNSENYENSSVLAPSFEPELLWYNAIHSLIHSTHPIP